MSQKWIAAGIILGKDPLAVVTCPECEKGILIVKDERIGGLTDVDRYLICNNCGKYAVISRLKIDENKTKS